jgi:transcriptional regulator with XRE-family HTH domain
MFKDKDPIIDRMRTIVQDSGETYTEISNRSGVTVGTLSNWFHGETKRPQFASLMAVCRVLGYDLEVVKRKEKNVVSIRKKA